MIEYKCMIWESNEIGKENRTMKTWEEAKLEELEIEATANGTAQNDDFDGTWVQINGFWFKPGGGDTSTLS